MGELTSRQRWRYLGVALAFEYGFLFAAFAYVVSIFAKQWEPGQEDLWYFLLACAGVASLFGWRASLGLTGKLEYLLWIAAPLFAPVVLIGFSATSEGDYWQAIACFAPVFGLTVYGLRSAPPSEPAIESTASASPTRSEALRRTAHALGEVVSNARAQRGVKFAVVAVLAVGSAILVGIGITSLHAPVNAESLRTSVVVAADSPRIDESGECFRAEEGAWLCEFGDHGGREAAATYRVVLKPDSSCWTATFERAWSLEYPTSDFSSCVTRFPRGWQDILRG
jgi:hypothetical protein